MSAPGGTSPADVENADSGLHPPSLLVAIALMLSLTVNPLLLANATGRADHLLAMLAFWAMSAGFVRGIGFVPRLVGLRWLLSGWACLAALMLAALVRLLH